MVFLGPLFAAVLAMGVNEVPSSRYSVTTGDTEALVFAGEFGFAGGQRQREGVADAVERAVEALLPIFRDFARKRLARANAVPKSVSLSMQGDELVIIYGDLEPMRAPLDGSVRHWHNREGTRVKLKFERRGEDQIVQTTWGGGGRRVMVWTLDREGQRLRLQSTMSSPSLPVSVDYRLTFRR